VRYLRVGALSLVLPRGALCRANSKLSLATKGGTHGRWKIQPYNFSMKAWSRFTMRLKSSIKGKGICEAVLTPQLLARPLPVGWDRIGSAEIGIRPGPRDSPAGCTYSNAPLSPQKIVNSTNKNERVLSS